MMTTLGGCSSVYYLYQAGRGQLKLLNRSRPVDDVINDPATNTDLADLLKKIPEIKAYGEHEGLKPTKNYRDYVQLDQDAVVYVVTVSEELEFKPKIFSFPIVGSFNYIGWFGLEDAKKFAKTYADQGYDIDVRGASAYSTLGWFRDPLLSTMISKEPGGKISPEAYADLVNVFLHESVHATVYISGQSSFNESLAVFVADKLTAQYFLDSHQDKTAGYQSYVALQKRYETIRIRLNGLYKELKTVYDSGEKAEAKRAKKEAMITALQDEMHFKRKITNATLIQYETYHSSEDDFRMLYEKTGKDIHKFMKIMGSLTEKDFSKPQQENLKDVMEKLAKENR
jgi:predicted aminopeptidase